MLIERLATGLAEPNAFQDSETRVQRESGISSRRVGIGRYQLGPLIAVGGMGAIHFAVLTGAAEFSRVVAIKRLHPQLAGDPLFSRRFLEEARLNARVLHANVVQLLDVVEADRELWLVMEYIDGDTLQALQNEAALAGRALPLSVVVGVMIGVLEGLHAAHETTDAAGHMLGIVHRDVSPQNIMISRWGQVKVIDFGVAKATLPAGVSSVSRLLGKVSYMSPEQASGSALDQRSDVFSAGIVLWEALTGQRLFRETNQPTATILRDVLHKPVLAPSVFRKEIPSALDAVVLRALDRDVAERFSSAREFSHALRESLSPAPPSEIGAYVTVFCEARLARRGPAQSTPQEVTSSILGEPPDRPEDEERTVLALTALTPMPPTQSVAVSKPHGVWHGARVRTGLSLAVALTALLSLCAAFRVPTRPRLLVLTPASVARRPITRAIPPPMPGAGTAVALPAPEASSIALAASGARKLRSVPPVSAFRSTRSGTPAAPGSPPPDCSTPTYLGVDGIHHFKAGCQ